MDDTSAAGDPTTDRPVTPGASARAADEGGSATGTPELVGKRAWLPAAIALFTAGWGVNQFTPLSVVYRDEAHWPVITVAIMFSTYLLGLVPALLFGGYLADRYGRRIVRQALLLSALASLLLVLGVFTPIAVFVSRPLSGVAAGIILSAGIAWVGELTARAGGRLAALRATYWTGGGFAFGALIAGCVVQWLPYPMVLPSLIHAAFALFVYFLTRRSPETGPPPGEAEGTGLRISGLVQAALRHPRFMFVVLPPSPAVFSAVTVAYVVLPPLVFNRLPGYEALFAGIVTALTLGIGIVIQPLAQWYDHPNSARATIASMVTVILGMLVGALAVYRDSIALVVIAAMFLGAGYGLTLASGLREVARLAPESSLPTATAIYHGAAHSGLLTPLLLAITAGASTTAGTSAYPYLLAGLAVIGLCFLLVTIHYSRRNLPEVR